MSTKSLWLALALTVVVGSVGCSSGTGGASDSQRHSGNASPYVKTCTKTLRDACDDRVSSDCDECHNICNRSSSPVSCYASCGSICNGSCAYGAAGETCEDWRFTVPLPKLDRQLYDACMAYQRQCTPETAYPQSVCQYFARTLQPEAAEEFACLVESGCRPDANCQSKARATSEPLGSELCKRQQECSQDCFKFSTTDGPERLLRPELVQGLQSCIAEPSCDEFKACREAYWWLAYLSVTDPKHLGDLAAIDESAETHADDELWGNECYDSSSCGSRFSCVQSCETCGSYCRIPCQTDADCVGQFVGTKLNWFCFKFHGDYAGDCSTP